MKISLIRYTPEDDGNIIHLSYFKNSGKYYDGRRMWYLYLNFAFLRWGLSPLFDFSEEVRRVPKPSKGKGVKVQGS
jgi:hypothetical protein